jgi:serine/threonine-protein kinase
MAFASVADLVQTLRALRLLEPEQLAEVEQLRSRFAEPLALARDLMQRNWLTAYQVNLLFAGRGQDLVLGSYVVLQRLGEGGMGQVFKARHQRLGRVVALKVIRKDRLANPEAVRRFGREVRLAAQLDHPNVVHTYDADESGGILFFAMEYVEGTDLTRMVRQRGPMPVARACDYARQAALGLDGCHQAGLVHRDIKPSNLLVIVPRPGEPGFRVPGSTSGHMVKLLDLGLARLTEPAGEQATRLTQLGSVLGTPDFLAPEQARDSRTADIRADLYSLGCTLYYILTGQTPFGEGTPMEKLLRHQMEEAPAVEKVRPEVPPALGAVVRKLMAKRPEDRYQTPLEAAGALEPFAHLPRGREPGTGTGRIADPSCSPAAAIPVTTPDTSGEIPAAVPVNTTTLPAPASARPAGATATAPLPQASPRTKTPRPVPTPARPVKRSAWPTLRTAGATVLLAGLLVGLFVVSRPWSGAGSGPPPGDSKEQPSPLDRLDPARIPEQARLIGQPQEVVAVLGEQRLRHWASARCVAFHPERGLVVSGGDDGAVRVWDAQTGEEKYAFHEPDSTVAAVAFRDADRILAVLQQQPGKGARVKLWELKSGNPHVVLESTAWSPAGVSLAPGGRFLASSLWKREKEGPLMVEIKVWDLAGGKETKTLTEPSLPTGLALAPDGQTLALSSGKDVRLLDVKGTGEKAVLKGHEGGVGLLAFAPDGATLASTAVVVKDRTIGTEVKLWKLAGNEAKSTFGLPGQVNALTFGPEGKFLALALTRGGASEVKLWNAANGKEGRTLGGFAGTVAALAFDHAGKILATAGADHAVRLWNLDSGKERVELQRHGAMMAVAFSPDAHTLAAAGNFGDQGVKLWDTVTGKERSQKGGGMALTYVAGGKTLAVWAPGSLTLLDTSSGQERAAVRSGFVGAVAPDGATLATAGPANQGVKLWDGAGKEIGTLQGQGKRVTALAFSADSKTLASGGQDGEVRLWDVAARKERQALPGLAGRAVALAFSPDGKLLASASADAVVKLWGVGAGKEPHQLSDPAPGQVLSNLLFSPDGKTLHAWGYQGVKSWDVTAEQARPLPQGQEGQTLAVALSPDGQRLATAAPDGRLQLRNPLTGEKLREVRLPGPVHGIAFAPDGRHLATANGNGTVYVLRLPPTP